MAKRIGATQAKAQFSDLVARVAHRGDHFVIERRGRPVAALVTVDEMQMLESGKTTSDRPLGALALVGAWREVEDDEMDSLIVALYAERDRDTGRNVDIDD